MKEKIFVEIKCDSCGVTEKKYLSSRDIVLYEESYVLDILHEAGWEYLEDKDICPKCMQNINFVLLFHLKLMTNQIKGNHQKLSHNVNL